MRRSIVSARSATSRTVASSLYTGKKKLTPMGNLSSMAQAPADPGTRLGQPVLSPQVGNLLAVTLIAAAGLYVFKWVFAPEMTFYMDDWEWLRLSIFSPWESFGSIWLVLPNSLFHDRPIE